MVQNVLIVLYKYQNNILRILLLFSVSCFLLAGVNFFIIIIIFLQQWTNLWYMYLLRIQNRNDF